jgi:hypothetical protein
MSRADIDRIPLTEIGALNEIARKKLYYAEEAEIGAEILDRLVEGLRQAYPDLLMVEIRDKIKRNYWEITSPNTYGDPNDNEEFQWYGHGDGTVHRVLTEHEQHEKNRREWAKKCRERRKEEDILEHYCYQILRRVPWYDQSFEEIEARTSTRNFMCRCTGESLRNGKICDICKLTERANDYMLNMFKDAAEGRSSTI